MSGGKSSATRANACESVITSAGGAASAASAAGISSGCTTRAGAGSSKRARSTCCWGKISRPLGAEESMGVTSSTSSPGETRPSSRPGAFCCGFAFDNTAISCCIPCPVWAETAIALSGAGRHSRSLLFHTRITGRPRRRSCCRKSSSSAARPLSASATYTAMSVLPKTSNDFSRRSAPSSPVSSSPAVSISTHGPSGNSSMLLYTGSVVVPRWSETMAMFWPVSALIKLDFPAFRLPNSAMCVLTERGA